MQSKITLKIREGFKNFLILLCLALSVSSSMAQGSLTTTYSIASGIIGGNVGITFVVENTNATPRVLTQIDMEWNTSFTTAPAAARLWYSATSLSGAGAGVVAPVWTLAASNPNIVISTTGVIPTFTNLAIVIPANTQYRFAVESTNGVVYGAATVTPNSFTADGVVLKTGNALISGSNVGYALNPMPNLVNNPRFFGGKIYWALQAACSGAPVPGNTVSTLNAVCPTDNFRLSTSVVAGTTGLTYQWQTATTAAGPWTDIPGAISSTYTSTQAAATFYRAAVTCTGGSTTNSAPLQVTMKTRCYCIAGATDTDPDFEKIGNVKFGSINQSSGLITGYSDYTGVTTNLERNSITPITVTGTNAYENDIVSVWIDFNQDGDFTDAGENVFNSAMNAGPYTGNITIPATAALGTTTMRIRLFDAVFGNGVVGSCGLADYGEVEDYSVNIIPCVPVSVSAQPVNATITCGANASFSLGATGTALTHQWQQRNNATSPWNNLDDGGVYSGSKTGTLTITNAPVTMNGYQYRVIYSGGCSGTDFSSVANLTINPLVATVSPTTSTICLGSIQQLTLTNPTSVATYGSPSGLPASIADGNVTGVNSTISVAGVPPGAVITSVSVTLNIQHPYVSDLEIVLRAPNGQILNLSNLVSGTNQPGANFVNTVFSSAGTAAISTGTAPGYTGTFKADAIPGPTGAFGVPAGPTGFLPTTTTWSNLYSTLNGNWTIAMYDAGPPDVGTLNNWSININFVSPPAQGVWTSSAPATMFTNAAATVPYTAGSLANSIYVKPTATTNYSVVYSTGTCTSAATVIPVTVNSPATSVTAVANKAICTNGSTTFTSTVTGGAGLTYQWKVAPAGSTTYTNVANSAIYSGATTNTLTITGAPFALNGNKYVLEVGSAPCLATTNITSAPGTLTVNATPVVTLTSSLAAIYPGQTSTITAAVSPNAAASYIWYKDGVVVQGATAATLVADVDDQGSYTVQVTDVNGCVGMSAATEISSAANDILFIYPNPNAGQFQLRYFSDLGPTIFPRIVNIYDSKGARVYSKAFTVNSPYTRFDVNLGAFNKGIYQVELTDNEGKRIKVGRVLVH